MSKDNVFEKLQSYSKCMELNEAVTENEISYFGFREIGAVFNNNL